MPTQMALPDYDPAVAKSIATSFNAYLASGVTRDAAWQRIYLIYPDQAPHIQAAISMRHNKQVGRRTPTASEMVGFRYLGYVGASRKGIRKASVVKPKPRARANGNGNGKVDSSPNLPAAAPERPTKAETEHALAVVKIRCVSLVMEHHWLPAERYAAKLIGCNLSIVAQVYTDMRNAGYEFHVTGYGYIVEEPPQTVTLTKEKLETIIQRAIKEALCGGTHG